MTDDTAPDKPADDATVMLGDGDATVIANNAGQQPGAETPSAAPSGAKALRVLNQRFELIELLGRGAMGHVYKAIDRRKVEANDKDPWVAIKLLTEEFQKHPDAFVTLQREARKAQNLSSEHIVKVFDFDRDGDTIYMTMEYLEGEPLDEFIANRKDGKLERDLVWKVLEGVCDGLSVAHRARIVHSDLKPGNIFVTKDGDAKLLDFGIARAVTDGGADVTTPDFDAGSLGALTPAYASLEMFSGAQPDPRDDIYALGCIAYELLSGEHPFQRTTAEQAAKLGATVKRLQGLDKHQWKALKGSLAFERDDRIGSVDEFEQLLIPGKRRRAPVLLTLAAAIVSAGVVGSVFFAVMPDGGEIAAQAKQEVDAAYTEAMAKSNACLQNNDFVCARDNVDIALKLHSDSKEAAALAADIEQRESADRERRANAYMAEVRNCQQMADFECASAALTALLALQPDHTEALAIKPAIDAALLDARARAETISSLESSIANCQQTNDDACLEPLLKELSELDPDNELLADVLAEQQARDAAALEAKISRYLAKAQSCFDSNQFACANREVARVLELDKDNIAALTLVGGIKRAQAKAAEDQRRVNQFVAEARECFNQKRYNCTIAKTESALAIAPNDRPAKKLKAEAEAAQQAAKSRIRIE